MAKTYTGIDIGTNTMKVAVSDGATIKNIAILTLPEGLMAEDRIVSFDAMADFIKAAVTPLPRISKSVAFVIPRSAGITRTLHIPAMTEKELLLNLPYEFRDYIAQGKDKYFYDYAVLSTEYDFQGNPTGMGLLAVASHKETMQDFIAMFRRAGLRLKIALPAAAALQNLVRKNQKMLANSCIIDFAYKVTQLHFFKNGLYDVSRVIDIGGADIDDAITRIRSIDRRIANEYKRSNFEGVLDDERVRSVYDSIAVEVGRAVNFYGFSNPDTTIEVIYFAGGEALVADLVRVVEAHIDIPLQDIATIMPPAPHHAELRTLCPAAVGATME